MANPVRMDVKGIKEVQRNLKRLGRKADRSFASALYREGEVIMRLAKVLCPVDRGNLRGTGHVRGPIFGAGQIVVVLGFGGPAAEYAKHVHDRTDLRHNPPTQAKYLSTPAEAAIPGMARRMARRVKRDMT